MYKTLKLRQQRAKLVVDAGAILKKAQEEKRDLTEAEDTQFADLHTQADALQKQIDRAERQQALETDLNLPLGQSLHQQTNPQADPHIGINDKEVQQYSLVRAIRAASTGEWRGAEFEREISQAIAQKSGKESRGFFVPVEYLSRDLTKGTPEAAGNLIATELKTDSFIKMLRNKLVVRSAGAQILTNLRSDISIPKQTGGATLYWVDEGEDLTLSNLTVGQIPMAPKTAGGATEFSTKLLRQSSIDIEHFVRSDLAATLATGLDYVALHGDGTNKQPVGIANLAGVNKVVGGANGAYPTWSHIVQLETNVAVNNADTGNLNYITNTKVRGTLKTTEKASGTAQYVWQGGATPLNGYPTYITNQVRSDLTKGTGNNLSTIFYGNWNDLIIGQWGTMEILVDPYTQGLKRAVRIIVFIEVDIAVRYEESFAIMEDAKTN